MASGGHSPGRSPPVERPIRRRQPPPYLEGYAVDLPASVATRKLNRYRIGSSSMPNLTQELTLDAHHSVGTPVSSSAANLACREGTARYDLTRPTDHRPPDLNPGARKETGSPPSPGSSGSRSSTSSKSESVRILSEALTATIAATAERERLQAEERMERERLQAERERLQAEKEMERDRLQAQIMTQALRNATAHSSAWGSRRSSCKGSRAPSPTRLSYMGPSLKEEPVYVAERLAERLQSLTADEGGQTAPLHYSVPINETERSPDHTPDALRREPPALPSKELENQTALRTSWPRSSWVPPSMNQQPYGPGGSPPAPLPQRVPDSQPYMGPYIGKPTFPDFTKEDRAQYIELRMCLETIMSGVQDERYKYAILLKHLKVNRAHNIALAYSNSLTPYSDALAALDRRYGRTWDYVIQEIREIERLPPARDNRALDDLSVKVQSLVGMLGSQREKGMHELYANSNVERILEKLPQFRQERFRRQRDHRNPNAPEQSLLDLADFLAREVSSLRIDTFARGGPTLKEGPRKAQGQGRPITVMHQAESVLQKKSHTPPSKGKWKIACQYCDSEHWLSQCDAFKKLTTAEVSQWIKANHRCYRCARGHMAAECRLKKKCGKCEGAHLEALHEYNKRNSAPQTNSGADVLYIDPAKSGSSRVLLKVVRVLLSHRDKVLDTYAVLDDGSEKTLLLASAATQLDLRGPEETMTLRTIRRDLKTIRGERVSFTIAATDQPEKRYVIGQAFTSHDIGLSRYDYPIQQLRERYDHLRQLPIPPISGVTPTLLIGSDHAELIVPTDAVLIGPRGCPAAVKTRLGWTLQGPLSGPSSRPTSTRCLYTKASDTDPTLLQHVERLWKLDTLPFKNERKMVRSKEDKFAIALLEQKTTRVEVNGVLRYVTPLLRREGMPTLRVPKGTTHHYLQSTERRLAKNPKQAAIYRAEIEKLVAAGHIKKIDDREAEKTTESWYVPHHKVTHHGKDRIVFNCSYQIGQQNLNSLLLPGPTLGPSLLGVLIRFRQDKVAISGDIKGMFLQVRLMEEDKPLLRFLWRERLGDEQPSIYQWEVLPFGTTCSPCCATFALQKHVAEDPEAGEEVRHSVERCFYVDNCLQSVSTPGEAESIMMKLRASLAKGGFDLRQWASSDPQVLRHLPPETKAASSETWMAHTPGEAQEMTLGLVWRFKTDSLHYRHTPPRTDQEAPTTRLTTRRSVYRTLASQYDPMGCILPYTTPAKMLVRELWAKEQGWDDPIPEHLATKWREWEEELALLCEVSIPRSYFPPTVRLETCEIDLHVSATPRRRHTDQWPT